MASKQNTPCTKTICNSNALHQIAWTIPRFEKTCVAMNGLNLYLYKYEPLRVNVTQRVENAAFRKTESYWHL